MTGAALRMGDNRNGGAKPPVFVPRMGDNHNGGAKTPIFVPRLVGNCDDVFR